jgi:predicted Rossmann fold nucleotide-binding protein DprA/Smf involved in DNA uptake
MEIKDYIGNINHLKLKKIAFLCSRDIPASAVLKCYDWAIEQKERGNCVISGFHSKIEKDVFHYLLKGRQPVIMVLARGMIVKLEPIIKDAADNGKLLIVTPFKKDVSRVTAHTAEVRNRFMIELADEIVVGYAGKTGMLGKIIDEINIIPHPPCQILIERLHN